MTKWVCAARKQSLPEPGDCDWPMCGCDPYANKVISTIEESGFSIVKVASIYESGYFAPDKDPA